MEADERKAERERKRREKADEEFARRLAEDPGRVVIDVDQIDRDEQLARRLSAEAAPATPSALEPVARVTPPTHLGTRRLRVGLPGGQAVTFELEETQPLSMVFELLAARARAATTTRTPASSCWPRARSATRAPSSS